MEYFKHIRQLFSTGCVPVNLETSFSKGIYELHPLKKFLEIGYYYLGHYHKPSYLIGSLNINNRMIYVTATYEHFLVSNINNKLNICYINIYSEKKEKINIIVDAVDGSIIDIYLYDNIPVNYDLRSLKSKL